MDEGTSSLFDFLKSAIPYKVNPSWSFAYMDSLRLLGAYKWQYWSPYSLLSDKVTIPSSLPIILKYFWNKLTVHFWILANNLHPCPDGTTSIVVPFPYPTPPFSVIILEISPFSMTGTNLAYFPVPLMLRFGGELYPEPPFNTKTSWIVPWTSTIASNSAFFPLLSSKMGCLS